MAYRAIRSFRIARLIVNPGEIYSGGDIDHLLHLGLIEKIEEPKLEEPKVEVISQQSEVASTPVPEKKKKKKA